MAPGAVLSRLRLTQLSPCWAAATHGCSRHVVGAMQVKDEGYAIDHNGYCITVFSAPNYVDQMGNKGAFIRFNGKDMVPKFTTYEAVPHPEIRPMAYASSFLGNLFGM